LSAQVTGITLAILEKGEMMQIQNTARGLAFREDEASETSIAGVYRIAVAVFCFGVATIGCVSHAHAADAAAEKSKGPDVAGMDSYLKGKFLPHAPGAAVFVMKDGKTLLNKGYGLANVELSASVKPDTVFHAASVSKQFTAAAVMKLADQGKLDIKAPISRYFPDVPETWHAITVENLLTHTSGIQNLFADPAFDARKGADMSAVDQFKYAQSLPLLAEPGARFNYASVNYTILAILINKISAQTYQAYISENFLKPLGMNHTTFDQDTKLISGVATPYGPGPSRAMYISPTLCTGACSYYTTNADLAKWTTALYAGRILSPAWVQIMTTEYQLKDGKKVHYGYGLRPHRFQGDAYIESTGDIPGFHARTVFLPHSKVYVAILSIGEDRPWFSLPFMVKHLAIMAAGDSVPQPKKTHLREGALNNLVGNYQTNRGIQRIHATSDHLIFEDVNGAVPEAIYPLSANEFFFASEPDLRVRFVIEGGHVTSLQVYEPNAIDDEQDPASPRIDDVRRS
jgi:D-alanyl-D-alanine carboxypeptidase